MNTYDPRHFEIPQVLRSQQQTSKVNERYTLECVKFDGQGRVGIISKYGGKPKRATFLLNSAFLHRIVHTSC